MLPHESDENMYYWFNVLVEKVNRIRPTQLTQSHVVRKILNVLPIDKYGHIITILHQDDLSTTTPTQILVKINAHEIHIHITTQDDSSSTKKKDLTLKAIDEKEGKTKIKEDLDCSRNYEYNVVKLAILVKKAIKSAQEAQ